MIDIRFKMLDMYHIINTCSRIRSCIDIHVIFYLLIFVEDISLYAVDFLETLKCNFDIYDSITEFDRHLDGTQ